VYQDGTVAFAGGQIIERSADGRQAVWGTVTRWEPPDAVAFTWHPGHGAERASHVEVTFTAADKQTLVSLTHSGWEIFDDPAAARSEYDQGWAQVLGQYAALLHRPGPSAPQDGPMFDDPRFPEHAAFLNRMREAGYLIAAGPLADEDGAGMTILRLPGADQEGLATVLATRDDAAVREGLLSVTVRPWQVIMNVLP
jgi:uncharacterized protein YciI